LGRAPTTWPPRGGRTIETWLDPLRRALDGSSAPVDFFFRDDDVGPNDRRLLALLESFTARELPIDLAVIPAELDGSLARTLSDAAAAGRVSLHQHGFAHVNHETTGRKYEFGPSRTAAQQERDIAEGWRRLCDLLGPSLDSIFTPPWNRCTEATGQCLAALGFQVLSREDRATPLKVHRVRELPVRVDWFAHHKRVRLSRLELGHLLAEAARGREPVGIMFHHAIMDRDERIAVAQMLDVLNDHEQARAWSMIELAHKSLQDAVQRDSANSRRVQRALRQTAVRPKRSPISWFGDDGVRHPSSSPKLRT
jgi:chorismate-pyruvate lyase